MSETGLRNQIAATVTPQTRAVFIAHTLGNPVNLDEVRRIVQMHDLFLIEDCCDALGSTYMQNARDQGDS
jgi:CDP-6-deoxy-D-xylo-4-hexulose-3-dehydrase